MNELPLRIVDVFAETPLAGNQLAVVLDAQALSTEQMLAIAREMNFSETTFVTGQDKGGADVRIFTPAWELPFAGHPTIGTAHVVRDGRAQVTLRLGAGAVPVTFEDDGLAWMVPPPVEHKGAYDAALAAGLLGLPAAALDPAYAVELAEVGPKFVLVPVKDRRSLAALRFDGALHAERLAEGDAVQCVFAFCEDAPGRYSARMFFESAGVREDPATGSANTAFASYLREHRGTVGQVTVDQGVDMGRPSRLYLDVAATLRVGGRVQPVVTGVLTV